VESSPDFLTTVVEKGFRMVIDLDDCLTIDRLLEKPASLLYELTHDRPIESCRRKGDLTVTYKQEHETAEPNHVLHLMVSIRRRQSKHAVRDFLISFMWVVAALAVVVGLILVAAYLQRSNV